MGDETDFVHDYDPLDGEVDYGNSIPPVRTKAALEFHVAGTSFRKEDVEKAHSTYLQWKTHGRILDVELVPEPTNKFDKDAIKVNVVVFSDLVKRKGAEVPKVIIFVGYVPKNMTLAVRIWQKDHPDHTAKVRYIGDNGTHTRNIGIIVELKEK